MTLIKTNAQHSISIGEIDTAIEINKEQTLIDSFIDSNLNKVNSTLTFKHF